QHKLTTRQSRVKAKRRDKSHGNTHSPIQQRESRTTTTIGWARFNNNQKRKKKNLSSPVTRSSHCHNFTITVIPSPQSLTGTPRSIQHAPLQHRPRNRRALPAHAAVMRSRCAKKSATSSQSNSSVSSTSLTIAGMPRLRNTHSATMSCRLSSKIMSATPNAYWRTFAMRCNHTPVRLAVTHCIFLSSLWLEHTSHPLSPRPGAARG
ncbi:hypothetical protein TcCL_Unassigned04547, partial [Trypanosoma cruzi]